MKKKQKNKSESFFVIGLGNPGLSYFRTRHNVGFMCVDYLSEKLNIPLKKVFLRPVLMGKGHYRGNEIVLVKPLTFMNRSGEVFPVLKRRHNLNSSSMIVLADNLDLPPGYCRLKLKGSSGGQNGIKSVIKYLGTETFMRLFIGIGRSSVLSVVDHVLGEPEGDEAESIQAGVAAAGEGVLKLFEDTPQNVMGLINKKVKR